MMATINADQRIHMPIDVTIGEDGMMATINADQRIHMPIDVTIEIGKPPNYGGKINMSLDAGFDVKAQSRLLDGKAIVELQGITPDKYMAALLEGVPVFLRLLADEIEEDGDKVHSGNGGG